MPRRTLNQHRAAIWQQLPDFKNLCGDATVSDISTLVVQEWPDEELAQVSLDSTKKAAAVDRLVNDVKRQLHLLRGDKNFDIAWKGYLRELTYEIVLLTYNWWIESPPNRSVLNHWKTVLVGDH